MIAPRVGPRRHAARRFAQQLAPLCEPSPTAFPGENMSFIAHNSPAPQAPETEILVNDPFFPDLDLLAFRSAMRIDAVTTTQRARHALYTAMLDANQRLASWAERQRQSGYHTLMDVPGKAFLPHDARLHLYCRAVWSLAKANLIERYRDYDTTHAKGKDVEIEEDAAADYRRDAAWAINDIADLPRVTVELI